MTSSNSTWLRKLLLPAAAVARSSAVAVIVLVVSLPCSWSAADVEPAPAASMFLVAARDLTDPNFSKAVVLLLRYDESGAMGVIVNRPTRALLREAIPSLEATTRVRNRVYLGGPVQVGTLRFLTRSDRSLEEADYVLGDIQISASRRLLDRLIAESPDDSGLRVYVGYSGWAPGQLEGEIARGGWHVVPATADQVFSADPEALWSELVPPPAPITAMARP